MEGLLRIGIEEIDATWCGDLKASRTAGATDFGIVETVRHEEL
jgi:hypothetical protein